MDSFEEWPDSPEPHRRNPTLHYDAGNTRCSGAAAKYVIPPSLTGAAPLQPSMDIDDGQPHSAQGETQKWSKSEF